MANNFLILVSSFASAFNFAAYILVDKNPASLIAAIVCGLSALMSASKKPE
jgi:uncharacterized membrane protein YadS